MSELFHQLGINWKLLLAQAFNFGIVLIVLTLFVYRPLMKLMEERRKKIEGGVKHAEAMEGKIKEIDVLKQETLAKADKQAAEVIGSAQKKGQVEFQGIVASANKKAEAVIQEAAAVAERKRLAEMEQLTKQAQAMVKLALIKTVELDPSKIDEKLIRKAVDAFQKGNPRTERAELSSHDGK